MSDNIPVYVTLAIDLGTTTSWGAFYEGEHLRYVIGDGSDRFIPSVVAFPVDRGVPIVGKKAKAYKLRNPCNTIYDTKRMIGRKYDAIVRKLEGMVTYKIVKGADEHPLIVVKDNAGQDVQYTPETVASLILKKIKLEAEQQYNIKVQNVVITVPAYFTDFQRKATVKAAQMANLNTVRLLNEPSAASLVYSRSMFPNNTHNLLVLDIGGGTYDCSVVKIEKKEDGTTLNQVLAVAGVNYLGGADFDTTIETFVKVQLQIHYLGKGRETEGKEGQDESEEKAKRVPISPEYLVRIKEKVGKIAEEVKIDLCKNGRAEIEIENLIPGVNFEQTMLMEEFELLNKARFEAITAEIEKVLKASKLHKEQISDVMLVGGSSHIPRIKNLVKELFNKVAKNALPQEDVVTGAAIIAAQYDGNPYFQKYDLIDAMPFDIGVEDDEKKMAVIVPRNTRLPYRKNFYFKSSTKEQKNMRITVYEGNNEMVSPNRKLGEFVMENLGTKKGRRSTIKLRVIVSTSTGMITLKAKDMWGPLKMCASLDRTGILEESKRSTEMETVTTELIDMLAAQYACNQLKNQLQSTCTRLQNTLEKKNLENDQGFESRRRKFKRYANETINWIHGPLSKRIKVNELHRRTQLVESFYQSTEKNQDWAELSDESDQETDKAGEAKVTVKVEEGKNLPIDSDDSDNEDDYESYEESLPEDDSEDDPEDTLEVDDNDK